MRASLNYLAPQREPLRTYAFDPPCGGPRFNGCLQSCPVELRDGRTDAPPRSLVTAGFALIDHTSAVADFWDEPAMRAVYYAEAQRLIAEITGATRVVVFDHTLRRRAPHRPPLDGLGGSFAAVREPVGRVHLDYTPASAQARLATVLGPQEAARIAQAGFRIYGLWRPINREPLEDAPLALADARSVGAIDLVVNELVYPERRGETYAVLQADAHRWYHFPRQRRDEALLFTHYDSHTAQDGLPRANPHTAFEDPGTPPGAPPRESIELRAFACFG